MTLGYAESGADLIKGDERHGQYATGDLAYFDEDGCFFIVGRKKRFLKIFGYRISLDETERMLKDHFHIECACVGNDKENVRFHNRGKQGRRNHTVSFGKKRIFTEWPLKYVLSKRFRKTILEKRSTKNWKA